MPFRSGGLSVRRYIVLGEPPRNLPQTATLAMRRYSFRPINEERGERESFGWINPRNLLSDNFTYDEVVDGPHLLLGVRRDAKNFSQVLFRARRDDLTESTKRERKLQKISRQHRLAIEEKLTVDVLRETSPQSTFAELLWDMNSEVVLIGGASNAFCERIQEVFEATFDLKLSPLFPALLGADYIATQGLEAEYFQATKAGR